MIVKEAINTLKSKNCQHEDKEAAYAGLISNLKTLPVWEEELKTQQTDLMKLLYRDILDQEEQVIQHAFQILNVCHGLEDIKSFEKSDSELGLKSLIQCGQKTSSLDVIKCILDFLSIQRLHTDVLSNEISALLSFIEEMNSKVKAQSASVVEQIVKVFVRLEKQVGKVLRPSSPRWSRLIFPGLVNMSHKVREESLTLLEKFREDLSNAQDLSRIIIKALNAGLSRSLKVLMSTHEAYVLRTWPLIVQVTGKELHKGSTINSLLEIIEIGFKGSHVGRHNAFIAWRTLIDNFALDRALLLDSKRIKLLLMVLRIDNAKVEHVAIEKLHTWWHFCSCIGAKLSVNFEMIVHPLLQFCVGNGKLQYASDLGQSPRLALKTSANNTTISAQSSTNAKYNLPVFDAVQKLGCQVIARLISKVGKSEDPGKITWAFDTLPDEVLGSCAVFVKHAPILMAALEKLLLNVGNTIEEGLVLHIWISLGNHLKAAMDSAVKTECRDIFSAYLTILHTMVKNQVLQTQTILKMIQICCSFPQKVLASTAYNITGGQTVRACPAQLLCEVLLTSYVMESAGGQDNFIKLFLTLMNAGASNLQGALLFLQTVTEMLDSQALSLPSSEILWKMWSTLANTLKDTISTTNEVNQGDALEYNFGCMYSVLLLPIKHQLSCKISQTVNKALLKTWKDLYNIFARLSALVATAEANSCFEEMCAAIIENWNPELQDPLNLEFVSNVCCKMLECVDFSAISVSQIQGSGLTLSPSKWVRRRQRPMGNLHSFVHLLASLQNQLNLLLSKVDDPGIGKKQDCTSSMVLLAQTQVEAHTKLFAYVTSTNVISNCLAILASPLAKFFQPNTKPSAVKLFVISFWTKLEKLWQEITHCIISRYNGSYDSELLGHLSPLLEATFLHSRRSIKSKTLALWNTTFGRNSALEYPNSLKITLIKVKEKNAIILPGLISNDDAVVVAETPFSEMSMGESQVPAPILPLLASPKRQKGSLLNRDVSPVGKLSPKPKASPAKIVSPKDVRSLFSGTRKRIDLDLLPKETFVVIESPITKRKRLLTEHQKEILKQKCVLPAMYNSIDSSQDISLMSQFGTETQQSVSSADVIIVSSSQSQEHTNVPLKGTQFLTDSRGNECCETPQFRRSTSSSPRRSVRIQELLSSDEFKCSEIKPRNASTIFITEDFNQTLQIEDMNENSDDRKRNLALEIDEKDISELQKSDSLGKSSQSYSCETHIDTSHDCDGSKSILVPESNQKDMDAPFLMFRTKQQTRNKINLSQSTKSPKKILLRKVRSQDDIPVSKLKQETMTPSPKQIKMPRRVPLKKINEQACELDNHKESSEDKSHGGSLSNVPKLGCWAALSEHQDTNKTEQPTDSPSNFPGKEQVLENDSSVDVSCTLVEDTQSPFKVKRHNKEIDHSIAETPLKGENSISPPVRAASARKLFVDCDTTIVSQTQRDDSEQAATCTVEKSDNKNKESSLLEKSEMTSSQGFEIDSNLEIASNLDIRTSAEQFIIESSHMDSGKECTQVDQCASDLQGVTVPESESLFPNDSPMDMMMPTLSSPLGHLQSNLNSPQCESHTTSSGDSSEAPNKLSSSSDADFNCSVPTLTEEVFTYTPNKRKKSTPKKLLQTKGKRGCRRHRKLMKGCHSCKNVSSPCHIQISGSEKKPVVDSKSINISLTPSSQNIATTTQSSTLADGILLPEAPVDSRDPVVFTKIKMSDKALQEIGEVTPDIKSPQSNPERRHSIAKRMRRPSVRNIENSKVNKSSASKKIKMEYTDSDNKMNKRRAPGSSEGSKNELKATSPGGKRQPALPSPGKLCRNKNLLKRRSKAICQQLTDDQHSLPKKRCLNTDEKDHSDDDDSLSLSSFLKKYRKDDSHKVSEDHNNMDACNQTLPDVQNAPVAAIEGSQNSDVKSSENPDSVSLHCSDEDLLMIDDAVNTALHRILLESSVAKTSMSELCTGNRVETVATALCSSLESPAVTDSPDISQDHMEPGQSVIILSPECEAQDPVLVDMSVLGDSIRNDTAESVEIVDVTNTSLKFDVTLVPSPQGDVTAGSLECGGAENIVALEIPQHDSVVDKCLNSESLQNKNEQKQPDEDTLNEQLNINKTCSSSLNSVTEDNEIERVIETRHQHENLGSPERNVVVIYDWSPTRSPSCSILKRCAETSPLGKSRRVSFAEPVVSGESPVREIYKEFVSASPLIPQHTSSPGQKASPYSQSQGKVSKYRRRRDPLKKQETTRSPLARKFVSPETPSSYKPTQESQLDNSGPVYPDLVDCTNPLDNILPQLSSSIWHRGLCQLMKGRNINTIGDLSALTEVQINKLPIRHPKVATVKSTLNAYMVQHGLSKSVSNGVILQDGKIIQSKGSTLEQEVTPANIDDEGLPVHPNTDKDLELLSPITDSESELQKMQPQLLELEAGSNSHVEDDTIGHSAPQDERSSKIFSDLVEVVKQYSTSELKKVSMVELFDIHQMLNSMFTNVVEEMKSRHSSA